MNFIDPKTTIQQMGLRIGMKVGDFGAGSGHYTIAAASLVGGEGRVYAIDVQEDILKHIHNLAKDNKLNNIETVCGNFEKQFGTKLREKVLDAAILSNTLFQLDDRKVAIEEIKRTLKSGGILLVVDWAGAYGGIGPTPEMIVSEHAAQEMFLNAGFHKVKDIAPAPHHYSFVLSAP